MASQNILLVEGPNDKHVFWSLLQYHQLPQTFEIEDKGGIERVKETMEVRLKRGLPVTERLGVVIDADVDLAARWDSLRSILATSGYLNIPTIPHSNGTVIVQEDKPTVGIWLMPDNKLPGVLEDFVSFLVPQGDLLWANAKKCVKQAAKLNPRFNQSKAHIHTWLAWQDEPGKPLGQAITARYLDASSPNATQLMEWLRQLFIP